jgi:hypothetical protein
MGTGVVPRPVSSVVDPVPTSGAIAYVGEPAMLPRDESATSARSAVRAIIGSPTVCCSGGTAFAAGASSVGWAAGTGSASIRSQMLSCTGACFPAKAAANLILFILSSGREFARAPPSRDEGDGGLDWNMEIWLMSKTIRSRSCGRTRRTSGGLMSIATQL